MKRVVIAMKRGAWINTLRAALEQAERPGDGLYEFTIPALDNAGSGPAIEVQFDNDDMERSEVPDSAVYVDTFDD